MANQWLSFKRSSYASVMASRRQFKTRQIRDLTTAVSQAQQSLDFCQYCLRRAVMAVYAMGYLIFLVYLLMREAISN